MEIRGTEKMKNITKEEMNIKEFLKNILMWQLLCQVELIQYFWFIWQKICKEREGVFCQICFSTEFEKKDAEKFAAARR